MSLQIHLPSTQFILLYNWKLRTNNNPFSMNAVYLFYEYEIEYTVSALNL